MNNDNCKKVATFHNAFGALVQTEPSIPDTEDPMLRIELLQEELNELKDAIGNNDLVEILDALGDLQYILDGTILTFGMQNIFEQAFNEIHRSNMSKLDENGKAIFREDGKILKSNNYSPPQLSQFIDAYAKKEFVDSNPTIGNEEEPIWYVLVSKTGRRGNRLLLTPTEAEEREKIMRQKYSGALTYKTAEEVDRQEEEDKKNGKPKPKKKRSPKRKL